jgi:hypothetical protein
MESRNADEKVAKSLGDLSFVFEWLKQVLPYVEKEWVSQHTQLSS